MGRGRGPTQWGDPAARASESVRHAPIRPADTGARCGGHRARGAAEHRPAVRHVSLADHGRGPDTAAENVRTPDPPRADLVRAGARRAGSR